MGCRSPDSPAGMASSISTAARPRWERGRLGGVLAAPRGTGRRGRRVSQRAPRLHHGADGEDVAVDAEGLALEHAQLGSGTPAEQEISVRAAPGTAVLQAWRGRRQPSLHPADQPPHGACEPAPVPLGRSGNGPSWQVAGGCAGSRSRGCPGGGAGGSAGAEESRVNSDAGEVRCGRPFELPAPGGLRLVVRFPESVPAGQQTLSGMVEVTSREGDARRCAAGCRRVPGSG